MATERKLVIKQGKTCAVVVRWETDTILYKQITAITQTAPVRITSAGHNIPDGWRVAVTNVRGMSEINAEANSIGDRDYHPATFVDVDTVELNDVNAAGFKPYLSGGYLQMNAPADLAGYTARMDIKDKIGGTVLASTDASDAPLNIITLTIDTIKKTIALMISAADTEGIDWRKGVYELEMVSPEGVVDSLLTGQVTVTREITT